MNIAAFMAKLMLATLTVSQIGSLQMLKNGAVHFLKSLCTIANESNVAWQSDRSS